MKQTKGAFVWDQSGIRIIGIMQVSVCLGAILIPEYLDSILAIPAEQPEYIPEYILIPEYFPNERALSCLNDAKIVTKSIRAFSRKLRVNFQGIKIQQKQSCFKCYRKLCPQSLTKWHSGRKSIF